MKIKKFICINCGAPKVNEYKSPYIMCDYCGSFTDIDYTLGLESWNESPERTASYQQKKIDLMAKINTALHKNDKQTYRKLQAEFWDYYYKTYPAYLPPSVDTTEKYDAYITLCAESSAEYGFDIKWQEYGIKQQELQNSLTYYYLLDGGSKVRGDGFFKLAEFFIDMTKEGMKVFYSNPKYALMNDVFPEKIHLKMKLSMFVQVWLPYLTDEEQQRLLNMTGFNMQYVEIDRPAGKKGECEHCGAEIFIPEGSYKVYCESCRKITRVQQTFKCMSCGSENMVPEYPAKPIDCEFCGVENRLIKALFG
jgi:DNA-directed RNA polymerase subunit RPC12/RpoP